MTAIAEPVEVTFEATLWNYLLLHYESLFASPAFVILISFAVYYCACLPYILIDLAALDWIEKYKIQVKYSIYKIH